MQVIPAIDLIGGRCVRLMQGDFSKETVYSDDPVRVARQWAAQGAERIHVVDLDGARTGIPVNMEVVGRIVAAVEVPVQLGGGIRTVDFAREALHAGVERVMVGTAALDGGVISDMLEALGPEGLLVSVDARDGKVVVSGWTRDGGTSVSDLVASMEHLGVRRVMYTDVTRDGTLTEPNYEAVSRLVGQTNVAVIAAGGIASVDHLVRLEQLGLDGAVVGRALYTGDVDLAEAIASTGSPAL
jgi:phosphoribosylformimino-5-aminoimidazole carboxamide ribotide isomerase